MNELTLREIRLKLGMTMDEMAEKINVPKSSYYYWESKKKFPKNTCRKSKNFMTMRKNIWKMMVLI